MVKVTRLTTQKRNKDRVNVYLDDEFAFGVTMITAMRLRIGQELSEEEITKLKIEDSYETAKQTAMNFISYRPRSISEVRRNLRDKSYDDETIDKVINRLVELDMLNDEAFVRYWVDQRTTFKPRSQIALRAELLKKGVASEAIDTVVTEVDETSAALQAAQKQMSRWRSLDEAAFRKKAFGFLQRRGFRYEIAQETIQTIWDALIAEREEE